MSDKTFQVHFGALADPFGKQLKKQGFNYDPVEVKKFDKLADAMVLLRFNDLIPDSVYAKMRQKMVQKIARHINAHNK